MFLLDAFGSAKLTEEYLASLTAAGVEVAKFRPVNWYALEKAYARSHIRVVVVDGCIGYTGGFGMDDKWLGNGRNENEWRDTNVRFEGPAVRQLQATFATGWAEATGELLTGDTLFPPDSDDPRGTHARDAAAHGADDRQHGGGTAPRAVDRRRHGTRSTSRTRTSCLTMISLRLLTRAPARGVDVRVLTPGTAQRREEHVVRGARAIRAAARAAACGSSGISRR